MKYRDENGKFCSKEKWQSLQKNKKSTRIPWPTIVTVGVLCIIILYEAGSVGKLGWWK